MDTQKIINNFCTALFEQLYGEKDMLNKQKMIADLELAAGNFLKKNMIANLSPEDMEEFLDNPENESYEWVQNFFEKKLPNLETITSSALTRFGEEYLK